MKKNPKKTQKQIETEKKAEGTKYQPKKETR
jgi:hypothetical protein